MFNKSLGSKYSAVTVIGLCLMLAGVLMYRFFDIVIFVALPIFSLGSAMAGASLLIKRARRSGSGRLIFGWSLVVLSVLPIVLVVLFINNWVGP